MSEKHSIRRRNWTEGEIKILIRSWSDHYNELICIRRNKRVYDKMVAELARHGYNRDASEIQLKIKNFSAQYRREKILQTRSTSDQEYCIRWKYFKAVGRILNSSLSDPVSLSNQTCSSSSYQDDLDNDSSESSSGRSSPEATGLQLNLSTDGNLAMKGIKKNSLLASENISIENGSPAFTSNAEVLNKIPELLKSNSTEDLFKELIREFKETNKSIKESDLLLRNLLLENNELIKQQNEYILQLLSK